MLLSVEWLQEFVDLGGIDPAQLGELFTLHVAEVDTVSEPGGGWLGVVAGKVLGLRPHPDADKLRLVTVNDGAREHEVVCGAPNVDVGQTICFAPEGTTLPDGLVLTRRKIRGVESAGMVLSERELGLSEEHEGILVLDDVIAAGTPAVEFLPGGAVIDVDNTAITTRPDLWGHYGAAREFAAILDRPLKPLACGAELPPDAPQVAVAVACPDLCSRYVGWAIGGVAVGPTPDWMRLRLEQAGQRSINNIVDLTNYIQLECGQPIHAFDRRQIAGGKIVVRRARKDEAVTTLDGVARELPEGACVIADSERVVAIAGVMGLDNSDVREDTTEIILEVANFEMTSVRGTAQALGLRTDSSARFEKGLDAANVPVAARRFFELLKQLCPDAHALGGPCDVAEPMEPARVIDLPAGFVAHRLGIELTAQQIDKILERLGFVIEENGSDRRVRVPSWRAGRDVSIPEDLVEEVGRIYGYAQIPAEPLRGALEPVPEEPARRARAVVRAALSDEHGYSEFFGYPFTTADECARAGVEPGSLRLANAEQPGLDLMATSLVPKALTVLAQNQKYRAEIALYMIAPVFAERAGQLPEETERLVLVMAAPDGVPALCAKGAVETLVERLRLKGARLTQQEGPAYLHPGRCARLGRGKMDFGWVGEIHPKIARAFDIEGRAALADLNLTACYAAQGKESKMASISRFPGVRYDVSMLVDRKTPSSEVASALRKADSKLVRSVALFDEYVGKNVPEGKRSLAYAIEFGAMDKTLDTADVERLRASVDALVKKRGWQLRS